MSLQHVEAGKLGGQPPMFKSPDELSAAVEAYFDAVIAKKEPPTMAGLARSIGCSRQTLINYSARDERYMDAIKVARSRVEEALEIGLYTQRQVAGYIFSLKNNFGWKDTQEVEHTHTLVMLGTGESPLSPPVIDITPLPPLLPAAQSEGQ